MTLDWPTLVTERLILRPWKPEDFEPYARFSADEEPAEDYKVPTFLRRGAD